MAGLPLAPAATSGGRRIALVASKFQFSQERIEARRGETIVLVVRSIDFVHGFALPELDRRIDVAPGEPVELTLAGLRAGRFTYLCDNFCGEDHHKMVGLLVVA